MLGGHKQYFWGGVHPEMHSSGTGLLLSGHNPRLGGTLLAWGAQTVIWVGTAPKCPRGAGPGKASIIVVWQTWY